jgi:hypothetical protein
VTPPPHSPSPEDLPSLGDIFDWQARISISARRPKWPRIETEPLSGLPSQPHLALVSSDL